MRVLVIAYYTTWNGYDKEAERLSKSLKRFELESDILSLSRDYLPSWNDAVSYKPRFILEAFDHSKEFDGYLYVDADAQFVGKPDFSIFETCDLSFHKFKRCISTPTEFLTGTMYFANVPRVKEFIQLWAQETIPYKHTDTPEQHGLKDAMQKMPSMNVLDLPPEWVWIFDDFPKIYGKDRCPIIKHYQASRRLRRIK